MRLFGVQHRVEPETEERMRRYLVTNPKDRNGPHVYSLGQFGLDAATERARYREYWDRWGVPAGS